MLARRLACSDLQQMGILQVSPRVCAMVGLQTHSTPLAGLLEASSAATCHACLLGEKCRADKVSACRPVRWWSCWAWRLRKPCRPVQPAWRCWQLTYALVAQVAARTELHPVSLECMECMECLHLHASLPHVRLAGVKVDKASTRPCRQVQPAWRCWQLTYAFAAQLALRTELDPHPPARPAAAAQLTSSPAGRRCCSSIAHCDYTLSCCAPAQISGPLTCSTGACTALQHIVSTTTELMHWLAQAPMLADKTPALTMSMGSLPGVPEEDQSDVAAPAQAAAVQAAPEQTASPVLGLKASSPSQVRLWTDSLTSGVLPVR